MLGGGGDCITIHYFSTYDQCFKPTVCIIICICINLNIFIHRYTDVNSSKSIITYNKTGKWFYYAQQLWDNEVCFSAKA